MDVDELDSDLDFDFDDDILKIIISNTLKSKSNKQSIDISSSFSDSVIDDINWDEIETIEKNEEKHLYSQKAEDKLESSNTNTFNTVNNGISAIADTKTLNLSKENENNYSISKELLPVLPYSGAIEENHTYNRDALLSYFYPVISGHQIRSYQQSSILSCIRGNSLVALPTGLGKTFVAAVVMGNYSRWFPNSLIIFLATTRPLVAQQAKACAPLLYIIHSQNNLTYEELKSLKVDSKMELKNNSVLSENRSFTLNGKDYNNKLISELNGNMPPSKREAAWSSSTFVFATPQTVQNDIKNGILNKKNINRITLLIVDEAHRTRGGYAFGNCMDELVRIQASSSASINSNNTSVHSPLKSNFRVLALTATPGADIKSVQMIVDRLHLAYGFFRTEQSIDVINYLHGRNMSELVVNLPGWHNSVCDLLSDLVLIPLRKLCTDFKVLPNVSNPKSITPYQVMSNTQRWVSYQSGRSRNNGVESVIWNLSMLSAKLLQALQLLQTQSFLSAYRNLNDLISEVSASKTNPNILINKTKLECIESPEFIKLERVCKVLVKRINSPDPLVENQMPIQLCGVSIPSGRIYSHPKLEHLAKTVTDHLNENESNTRIMIFTQFRESVEEIVAAFRPYEPLIRPVAFVGQSNVSFGTSNNEENLDLNTQSYNQPPSLGGLGFGSVSSSSGRGNFRGRYRGQSRGRGRGGSSSRSAPRNGKEDGDLSFGSTDDPKKNTSTGSKGLSQKEQKKVVEDFSKGIFNVLIATCVAEEGLDIGEVDLVIHYDAPRSPIQLLQRTGRTGRTRKGGAIVMLTNKTNEYQKYKEAIRKYQNVQKQISKPGTITWHKDLSPTLLPNYFEYTKFKRQTNQYPIKVEIIIKPDDYKLGAKLGELDLMTKAEYKKVASKERENLKKIEKDNKKILKSNSIKKKQIKKSNKKSTLLNFDNLSGYNSNGSSIGSEKESNYSFINDLSDAELKESAKKLIRSSNSNKKDKRKIAFSDYSSDLDKSPSKSASKSINPSTTAIKNLNLSENDSEEKEDKVSKRIKAVTQKSKMRSSAMEKLLISRAKNQVAIQNVLKEQTTENTPHKSPKKNSDLKETDIINSKTSFAIEEKPKNSNRLAEFKYSEYSHDPASKPFVNENKTDCNSYTNNITINKQEDPNFSFINLEDSPDCFDFDSRKIDVDLVNMAKKLEIDILKNTSYLPNYTDTVFNKNYNTVESVLIDEISNPKHFSKLGSISKLVSSDSSDSSQQHPFIDTLSFNQDSFSILRKELIKNENQSHPNYEIVIPETPSLHETKPMQVKKTKSIDNDQFGTVKQLFINSCNSENKADPTLDYSSIGLLSDIEESFIDSICNNINEPSHKNLTNSNSPKLDNSLKAIPKISNSQIGNSKSSSVIKDSIILSDDIDFSDIESSIYKPIKDVSILNTPKRKLDSHTFLNDTQPKSNIYNSINYQVNSNLELELNNEAENMVICSSISDNIDFSFDCKGVMSLEDENNNRSNDFIDISGKIVVTPTKSLYNKAIPKLLKNDSQRLIFENSSNKSISENTTCLNTDQKNIDDAVDADISLVEVDDIFGNLSNKKSFNTKIKPTKKLSSKRKSRPKSIANFFDDEAESESDDGGNNSSYTDIEDSVVQNNKKGFKSRKHINEDDIDEDLEDLDRSLDDGFIVSDGHIVYNSSQSISTSQHMLPDTNEFSDNLSTSNDKSINGGTLNIRNDIQNGTIDNEIFHTPKNKTKSHSRKKSKNHGYNDENKEPPTDDISLYRRAYNNDITPVSEIKKQVKIWEDKFLSRERQIKEKKLEKMGSRVSSTLFSSKEISRNNSSLLDGGSSIIGTNKFTIPRGYIDTNDDDDFEQVGIKNNSTDQDYYNLLVKNRGNIKNDIGSPLGTVDINYDTYLSQSSLSILDDIDREGTMAEPDEFDELLDSAFNKDDNKRNKSEKLSKNINTTDDTELITNSDNLMNSKKKSKRLKRGRKKKSSY
ncbi:ATP-dependent DNA helicase MPH1 [Smittium culicis]|uniref:ATP-dependent DNA helicase MPH1 n=1 Tax=Smittium culicis TaxID=133412 RepID=A0A1R1YD08_9FUNG|nr:ATP-dependent DNA helicase MPH1 [Smittium culicis]